MTDPDPKKIQEDKKKAEHEQELVAEHLRDKQRDELLAKQKKQRETDEKQRILADRKRKSDADKRALREKELEIRSFGAELDRVKNALKRDEQAAGASAGAAVVRSETVARELNRTVMTKKYRIEFLAKEISRMEVEIESKKREAERLKQEIQVVERQSGHETARIIDHAGTGVPDAAKMHKQKTQVGEMEFRLQQMNQEILALKRAIQKGDADIRDAENELRALR